MELSNPMKIFEEFEMGKLSDLVRKLTAEVDELEGGLSKEIMERYERVKKYAAHVVAYIRVFYG